MRARGADREEIAAATREQDGFIADVAADHLAVGKRVDGDAKREVGPGGSGFRFAHVNPPSDPLGTQRHEIRCYAECMRSREADTAYFEKLRNRIAKGNRKSASAD